MDRIVREYFMRIDSAIGQQVLCSAVNAIVGSLDFRSFAFLVLPDGRQPHLVSTYRKEWTSRYITSGYEGRDPVIVGASCVREEFVWDRSMAGDFGDDARAFFCEAEKFGIRCGLTIPPPGLRRGFSAVYNRSPSPRDI